VDENFVRMGARAGGGDFVVIRASGSDASALMGRTVAFLARLVKDGCTSSARPGLRRFANPARRSPTATSPCTESVLATASTSN
jgi:hypothetical protein